MLPPSRPQLAFIWQEAWTALDQAFSGQASMAANLRLNGLLTDLVFSDVAVRQEKPLSRTQEVAQELSRFLERLRGRTKPSEQVTINSFLKLSEDAQQILGSMIALETRVALDNFAQIDFGRPDHHQALLAAANRALRWTSEPAGRPRALTGNTRPAGLHATTGCSCSAIRRWTICSGCSAALYRSGRPTKY